MNGPRSITKESLCGATFRISKRLTLRVACWLPKGHEGEHASFSEVRMLALVQRRPCSPIDSAAERPPNVRPR